MSIVDFVIIAGTLLFVAGGWRSGFVRSLGSVVALGASVVAAYYAMMWLNDTFGAVVTMNPWFTIVTFISLALAAHWLAMYVVSMLDLARKVIAIIPFVNLINRFLGAVLGLAQSAVLVLFAAYIAVVLLPMGDIRSAMLSSHAIGQAVNIETALGLF